MMDGQKERDNEGRKEGRKEGCVSVNQGRVSIIKGKRM